MSHNQKAPQSGSSTGRGTDKDSLIREIESNFEDDQITIRVGDENQPKPEAGRVREKARKVSADEAALILAMSEGLVENEEDTAAFERFWTKARHWLKEALEQECDEPDEKAGNRCDQHRANAFAEDTGERNASVASLMVCGILGGIVGLLLAILVQRV